MKHTALILLLAAGTAVASAQTPAKPASKTASTGAKPAVSATHPASSAVKLPPGIPPGKGLVKTVFTVSLRYQDIKVGTGATAEAGKMLKVHYTGWRAADGVKFDSSYDHVRPVMKDGKPVLGDDGKPKMSDPEPMPLVTGMGRTIPGFDMGFEGMKVGGKRRLFIPYQLAYGNRNIPDHGPEHPGIPAKSDLIFDVELMDVTDMPAQAPGHPMPMNHPNAPGAPPTPPAPGKPAAPAAAPAPGTPAAPAATAPAAPAATSTPAAPASK